MNPEQLIYEAIFQKSVIGGATNDSATNNAEPNNAELGVVQYRQNTFRTVSKLIDERVKEARKFKAKK